MTMIMVFKYVAIIFGMFVAEELIIEGKGIINDIINAISEY